MSRVRFAFVQLLFFAVFLGVLLSGAVKRNMRRLARGVARALGRRCDFCQGPRFVTYRAIKGGSRFCSTCAPSMGLR